MRGIVLTVALFAAAPALAGEGSECFQQQRCCETYDQAEVTEPTETQRITAGVASGGLLGLVLLGTAFHAARRLDER